MIKGFFVFNYKSVVYSDKQRMNQRSKQNKMSSKGNDTENDNLNVKIHNLCLHGSKIPPKSSNSTFS